ncbi:MAG TPA: serine/threonine-protein kinase, partial [Thermoanaerobaculia bacterium]|nr:serine/threonine-protein kinase [Thermoanaerobaculia bacterium]
MDRARWNQIESVLQEALDREPRERPAFLDASCAHDDDLRRRVEELLQRESRADRLDVPAAATLTLTGMTVGHYRIERRIGAGGMGEVYAARDELLQRVVAVKALAPELTGDADRVRRFEQEAVSASRLNHPNIITIFDVIARDGAHFIVTELIEGQTLRELLISKLEPRRALDLTMQIAMALKAAHTSWIIHRDIKPENIMVRGDGVVKVLDFGIAKLMEEDDAGAVVGTARYMSPEQTRGEPLDGRTDLYSLGLVLHEMLTGERPRAHDSLDRVPREFRPILRRMLHDDREHRYASAAELLDDLLALERRMDGRTARLVVAAALAAALAIATIAALLSRSETWEERTLRDGHTAAARQAVFSPDGRTLVSCGEDGAILVWDVARHERVRTITGAPARNVAFSPDGKWFATGGVDGTVTIWDAMRGAKLRVLRGHHATIDALGISGDGAWLASSSSRNTVLWDARRWTRARDWPYRASYGNLVFSGDTQRILFSFGLAMFDARSGAVSSDPRHSQNWIAVSPDGTGMASVDAAGEVSFYRLASRGDVRAPRLLERRAAHQDHGRSIAYSPDGTLIASAAEDIILWDATTHAKLARFESPAIVWSVAFSPDGRWLLSTHADGALLLWDVAER